MNAFMDKIAAPLILFAVFYYHHDVMGQTGNSQNYYDIVKEINGLEEESNVKTTDLPKNHWCDCYIPRKRHQSSVGNILEKYSITIKPNIFKSSSCTDLTLSHYSSADYIEYDGDRRKLKDSPIINDSHSNSSGDGVHRHLIYCPQCPMSWSFRVKNTRRRSINMAQSYGSKYIADYTNNFPRENDPNSSCFDQMSSCSTEQLSIQKGATFPFKATPSGNLKVKSNQVVFQCSTVGVLLADPNQAKVEVKFKDKSGGEPDDDLNSFSTEDLSQLHQYGTKDLNIITKDRQKMPIRSTCIKDDMGKELSCLGYTLNEPVDWMRVQLPKKQDLFQEFYRRIRNYLNTDTIIKIGHNEFHCHKVVLQIYSQFFDQNPSKEIDLPMETVSPETFQSVYEWMTGSGQETNKILRKDNILDLFCTAQYLGIKDLEDQCWAFIVNDMLFTEDTAFALYREAKARGMNPIMDLMVPRVMRFFLPLVASRNFLELEPDEVVTFLKSNYISVTSEIEILMAGVRWLHGDWSSRRRHVVPVMRCVRFGLISPWQLVDIKRNPDNGEILDIVNEPEVQQMIDDGLAYVIIKYWYGNNSKNYYHWIDVLGLSEPAERNWIGEEKNHVTYKDFLKYLEQFSVPKEQMYQQIAMMQTTRRSEDGPGMRGIDSDKMDARRPKKDFPLPNTLKSLPGDKDKYFPTMSEFFENRRRTQENKPIIARSQLDHEPNFPNRRHVLEDTQQKMLFEEQKRQLEQKQHHNSILRRKNLHNMSEIDQETTSAKDEAYDLPEKDSEETNMSTTDSSSATVDSVAEMTRYQNSKMNEKRHSIAANFLAAATAGLGRRTSLSPSTAAAPHAPTSTTRARAMLPHSSQDNFSPQISLFHQSKESLAKINMNKLSTSILGPSNKNYISEGSLFNWDRETVLVFGGIDPHTPYGTNGNAGKDIYRFDPVTNIWDYVGELPEPRHHHSVAFLRGRVYLAGGADPRDDDIRGKSVVVSTVWSFEPVTRSWYSESGLAVPRKNFGLVVHKMALYAIGGQDKKGRVLSSVERFDPKTASWTEMRSMGVARMAVACTKYREYIWVAGGMTGEKKRPVCKIVECYNSNTNEWTQIHNLRFPRCFATLFSMNDKLYIIGGAGKMSDKDKTSSSVGAIDCWDWKMREWRQETEMSMPRHGHALAYLGTQLIIIGGVTTIYMRALNNVESYCCERGAWIRGVATLPSPLSGHGAITLPPASLM